MTFNFYKNIFYRIYFIIFILIIHNLLNKPIEANLTNWAIDFHAATPVTLQLKYLHHEIVFCIGIIICIVFCLITISLIEFYHTNNPEPSLTFEQTLIELIWTLIPFLIILIMMLPSLSTSAAVDDVPDPDLVLQVVGYQWYWEYEYLTFIQSYMQDPEHNWSILKELTNDVPNSFSITSYSQVLSELKIGEPRLLEVDHRLVLPEGARVKFEITSGDVIHSWALPDFGAKLDAIPGRINTMTLDFPKQGIFYGQCSELCGQNHGQMPIAIEVVSEENFRKWINQIFSINRIQ